MLCSRVFHNILFHTPVSSQTKKKESEKKSESKLRAFIKRSSEPLINFQSPQVTPVALMKISTYLYHLQ